MLLTARAVAEDWSDGPPAGRAASLVACNARARPDHCERGAACALRVYTASGAPCSQGREHHHHYTLAHSTV